MNAGGRVPFADGFRALAAFSVVFGHLLFFCTIRLQDHLALTTLLEAFGLCGVMCFFVLSGFLLSRPYIDAILETPQALPSWRTYAKRRIARIYPLYALAVVVSACGPWVHGHPFPWAFLLSHLTFAHGFLVSQIGGAYNGPLWTMAVDAQFYVLLPIVMTGVAAVALRLAPERRTRLLALTFVAFALLGLLERTIAFAVVPDIVGNFDRATVFARNAIGLAPAFASGMMLALVMRAGRRPSTVVAVPAIVAGIALGVSIAWSGIDVHGTVIQEILRDAAASTAVSLAMFGALRWAGGTATRSAPAARRRRHPAAAVSATVAFISYPFYLFHWPVLFAWFDLVLHRWRLEPGTLLCAGTLVAGGFVAASGTAFIAAWIVDALQRAVRQRPAAIGTGVATSFATAESRTAGL